MEQPQPDEHEMGELMGLVLHTTKMEEGYQHVLHTVLHNGQRHKLPLRNGDIVISICDSDATKMNHNEVEDKLRFIVNISLLLHRPGQQVVENELSEDEAQDGNEKMAEVTFPVEKEGDTEDEETAPSFHFVCEDNLLLPSDMSLARGEEVGVRVDDMSDDDSEEEGNKMASITQKNRAQHHAICHRPQQETTHMSTKTPSVTKVSERCCGILEDAPTELHDAPTSLILYRNARLGDSARGLLCVEKQQLCPVCSKGGSDCGCTEICVEIEHKVENPVKVQRGCCVVQATKALCKHVFQLTIEEPICMINFKNEKLAPRRRSNPPKPETRWKYTKSAKMVMFRYKAIRPLQKEVVVLGFVKTKSFLLCHSSADGSVILTAQKLDRSKLQRIKETDDTWKFVFFRKSSSGGSSMTFESAAFPGWYISSRESGTSVRMRRISDSSSDNHMFHLSQK